MKHQLGEPQPSACHACPVPQQLNCILLQGAALRINDCFKESVYSILFGGKGPGKTPLQRQRSSKGRQARSRKAPWPPCEVFMLTWRSRLRKSSEDLGRLWYTCLSTCSTYLLSYLSTCLSTDRSAPAPIFKFS